MRKQSYQSYQYLDLIGHYVDLIKRKPTIGGSYTNNASVILRQQKLSDNKVALTKLLESCYEYSVAIAINSQAQIHPFPSDSLIMALLLTQHKVINHLKSVIASKQSIIEDD
jgi:hypothetical protein